MLRNFLRTVMMYLALSVLMIGVLYAQESPSSAPEADLIINDNLRVLSDDSIETIETAICDFSGLAHPDREHLSFFRYSPDRTKIVYEAIPASIELSQFPQNSRLPWNIWLCDLATLELSLIAEQPDDFSIENPHDHPFNQNLHTIWSLDSSTLAWGRTVVLDGEETLQTIIYNLESDNQTIVEGGIPAVWGEIGVVIWIRPYRRENTSLEIYDQAGNQISQIPLSGNLYNPPLIATDEGQEWIVGVIDNTWIQIDPLTGEMQSIDGVPEIYSLSAPEELSIAMIFDSETGSFVYTLYSGETSESLGILFENRIWRNNLIAIAPDGRSVAYVTLGAQILRWDVSETSPSVLAPEYFGFERNQVIPESVTWGLTSLRLRHNS